MGQITFQVIEGLEAGQIFSEIETPLTIGREEDNDIQLNDERISRFHAKVQDDSGRLILTDLDSTNGTRVNGHPIRMRVLRPGDLVMVGRCILLVGGPDELDRLNSRLLELQDPDGEGGEASEFSIAFPDGPPPSPENLTTVQAAELSDLLEFIRCELVASLSAPVDELRVEDRDYLRVPREIWHRMESLAAQIARYQNRMSNPGE